MTYKPISQLEERKTQVLVVVAKTFYCSTGAIIPFQLLIYTLIYFALTLDPKTAYVNIFQVQSHRLFL